MNPDQQDNLDPYNTKRPRVYELSLLQKCIFYPVSFFLILYFRTWRIRLDPVSAGILKQSSAPRQVVTWHNRSLVMPEVFRRFMEPERIHCLISPSRMAAWEVDFFRLFRIHVVRGSTTRRSIQAARELLKASRLGNDSAISPDGPSGPLYTFQPGAVAIARKAGIPLLILMANTRQARRLNTWDRHLIPWPFARISLQARVIRTDDPVWQLDNEAAAAAIRRVCLEMTEDPFQFDADE